MHHKNSITVLVIIIVVASIIATTTGILSNDGPGIFEHKSIRGETVQIYGKGIYKHMSNDVAIQGIAQDYITLFFAVPVLLISLLFFRRGSLRGKFILTGSLLYILLTYLFYTAMATYNSLFLIYVILLSTSLLAFILSIIGFDVQKLKEMVRSEKIQTFSGWFVLFNSSMIALLWLKSIVTPLLSGALYPEGLDHYTTMIVQGFDLGIFLPMAFISGFLAVRKNTWGIVLTTVYVIFVSILMSALTSKILFMAKSGANVVPVVFIMPTICVMSIILSVLLMMNIKKKII